jgi:23S rRNA (adenine2503-C2)-methyltransferase
VLQIRDSARHQDVLATDAVFERFESAKDVSVNWIAKGRRHGFLEARYVRRTAKKLVVYVSVATGCKQACRMCHLTATGQTKMEQASTDDIVRQSRQVLEWYDANSSGAEVVHFDFMARGEPLDNPNVLADGHELLSRLASEARCRGLFPKFLISTIIPRSFREYTFCDVFPVIHPEIYYSIYSMDEKFRKRWLPKAVPAEDGLMLLKGWQERTSKIPKLHFPLIGGANDSPENAIAICRAVRAAGLRVNVNLIRYNPYSEAHGYEPSYDVYEQNAATFREHLPDANVKIITRVGLDVNVACGMFVK